MVTAGGGEVVESGLAVRAREGVVFGPWVGEATAVTAVLTVVLTELGLQAAAETPPLAPAPGFPVAPTRSGLSSDCWMIFTPSGLDHDDSRVLAL